MHRGREIHSETQSLPQYSSVFQAELVALERAARWAKGTPLRQRLTIHTDSLASIQALKSQIITSQQCKNTIRAIDECCRTRSLSIFWIKAHEGNEGNERADRLAKGGTIGGGDFCEVGMPKTTLKSEFAAQTEREWEEWWQTLPDCRKSRTWMPNLSLKRSEGLLSLGRQDLGQCLQWITGFCNLQYHKGVKRAGVNKQCRLCFEADETPEHLTWFCPRLTSIREDIFSVREGWGDWTPGQLCRFIQHATVRKLLTDHKDYDAPSTDEEEEPEPNQGPEDSEDMDNPEEPPQTTLTTPST